MRKGKIFTAADLFCGAGGSSSGLVDACKRMGVPLKLIAVNHWDVAIQTHTENHPDAEHLCTNLDTVDPRKIVPGGYLDLLIASPECIHHSNARGGKPMNDQSRASAWRIVEWASQIRVQHIWIENVPEFQGWGPLGVDGRPLKSRKGETYFAFISSLESLGYKVEARVLNAADYGDPTSRKRLFIQARLGRRPIVWPDPTHSSPQKLTASPSLFDALPKLKPHRPAREIIDWSLKGESIFTRKRPLKPNTMARIFKGLQKFSGLPFIVPNFGERAGQQPRTHAVDAPLPAVTGHGAGALVQPYLVKFYGGADSQSLDHPLPAVTANYEHYGLADPYLVLLRNKQDAQSVDQPLSTITTKGAHHALCQPYLVVLRNNADGQSLNDPLRTLTTGGNFGLAEPFILNYHGDHKGRGDGAQRHCSINDPLPTLDTSNRYALCEPFIIGAGGPTGSGRPRGVGEPLGTVLTDDHRALVQPFIIPTNHGKDGRSHNINNPMPTVTSVDAWGLIQPYLVKFYGTGEPADINDPLDTVTAKDRFGLVQGELGQQLGVAVLDIRFRMLQPHELAAAMSFPKTYKFAGNREQKVKQIGNAVPRRMARALCTPIVHAWQ